MTFPSLLAVALLAAITFPNTAVGQEWGDLKFRIVYDGKPPEQPPLAVTSDQEFCCQTDLLSEKLVVNPDNLGVSDVFVYIYLASSDPKPAVHESYAATARQPATLDNAKCRFEPHALAIRTNQPLIIGNKDPVGHNSRIDTRYNQPINPVIPADGAITQTFTKEERLPCKVSCNIHPWMSAWVLVRDNPYMAVSDRNGAVEIKNLPVGKWTFQLWQEKAGYVSEVKVSGKPTTWARGRVEIDIKPGNNDLGDVLVPASLFEKE